MKLRYYLQLFGLLLMLLSGCVSERQRALNQANRYTQKVLAIYAKYPDLKDTLTRKEIDTLRTPERQQDGQWNRPLDTAAYDQLLNRYIRALGLGQHPSVPTGSPPVTAEGHKKLAKAQQTPISATARSQQAKIIRQLRDSLRSGAYKDSTYTYTDKYLSISFTITKGNVQWSYKMKPQAHPYVKTYSELAPQPALPEQCKPKRFWQDWLFWVLLGVIVVVRLLWRTIKAYVLALLP